MSTPPTKNQPAAKEEIRTSATGAFGTNQINSHKNTVDVEP